MAATMREAKSPAVGATGMSTSSFFVCSPARDAGSVLSLLHSCAKARMSAASMLIVPGLDNSQDIVEDDGRLHIVDRRRAALVGSSDPGRMRAGYRAADAAWVRDCNAVCACGGAECLHRMRMPRISDAVIMRSMIGRREG